ncbi:DegT/DnrJ/EryC1/StrS family aminotransferase [Streptomyces sp. NPDC054904]|uniref:DegT/DnrJ/EryC1/StrS family aminotransferase n=1 Tax=unclassified Streptomyces TaxID=2593676 RepID=UPI002481CC51|nr:MULTISPECIES: DegT/DnrJ/EryC1/StrS family aminotransferase [unclassified Streptomyces]MDA5283005.1 DegT/DnrJ/EryC1/StrS family aminotransferase [Streptomyces sp. Isolate_45]MDX2394208.1 DegT/DnrJ/EryC1/StrS family aminotransferase [Streptomyces sp. DK15]
MINLFQPQVGAEELEAVAGVFQDRWLGHGPRTKAFEAAFAEHLGVAPEHVVFINSATSGLFLATEALDLRDGDEVVLPSLSFLAAANAVLGTGGRPVFCDVDPRTLNPTLEDVEAVLTERTRAVVVLHYGGYPGDIVRIAARCRELGITLIEDAACSVDSRVDGRAVGTFGDLAMWSFDAMKVLVTGDGGMIHVKDAEQAARVRRLAYHGLAQSSGFGHAKVSARWWELDIPEPGRRVIGNDLTAAIGSVQLRRLPEMVARRKDIVDLYDRELASLDGVLTPPPLPAGHASTYYFYWVQMDPAIRDAVAGDLLADDIYTTFRYAPLHKVPAYAPADGPAPALPGSDWASDRTLCLPLHPGLSDADVLTVVASLRKAVEARSTEAQQDSPAKDIR